MLYKITPGAEDPEDLGDFLNDISYSLRNPHTYIVIIL